MIGKNDRAKIKRWLADATVNRKEEITAPDGSPYIVKLQRMIKSELGMTVTRQTVATYLKEDLTKYLNVTDVVCNSEMREYNVMMQSAKDIWDNMNYKPLERTKAYNSWLRAKKQREALERMLQAEEIRKAEVEKPTYLISFKPGEALRRCPECGHEFFDNVEKVENVGKTEDEDKEQDAD